MKSIWILQYEFADVLCDSSTRRDLNFFVLLRLDVVKLAYVLLPSSWFYKRYYFCQ